MSTVKDTVAALQPMLREKVRRDHLDLLTEAQPEDSARSPRSI